MGRRRRGADPEQPAEETSLEKRESSGISAQEKAELQQKRQVAVEDLASYTINGYDSYIDFMKKVQVLLIGGVVSPPQADAFTRMAALQLSALEKAHDQMKSPEDRLVDILAKMARPQAELHVRLQQATDATFHEEDLA